jgi:hypothetical protein
VSGFPSVSARWIAVCGRHAETIWIAPGTVRKHLENVYEKLGVHSRTAAVPTLNGEN